MEERTEKSVTRVAIVPDISSDGVFVAHLAGRCTGGKLADVIYDVLP